MNIATAKPDANEIEMLIKELKSSYPVSSRYSNAIPENDESEYEASDDQYDVIDIGIDADYDFDSNH